MTDKTDAQRILDMNESIVRMNEQILKYILRPAVFIKADIKEGEKAFDVVQTLRSPLGELK